jgi:hypothetical protein
MMESVQYKCILNEKFTFQYMHKAKFMASRMPVVSAFSIEIGNSQL